ncbi:MAG: metallophosphoesterase family protein [Sedimentisphaeraceae bacterium JB056]
MKITALSDIHNKQISGKLLENDIKSSDLVVISGDITSFASAKRASVILDELRSLNNAIAGITGNCDTEEIAALLKEYGISVNGTHQKICGINIIGVNGVESGRFHGKFYNELTTAAATISQDEPLILITHQPCAGTKISDRGGYDGGSCGIRKFITQRKPMLAFSGHIHEAFGQDKIGPTTLINPGAYTEGRYAVVEVDIKTQKTINIEFKTC